ncbi:MAG TPA: thioredoxin family protein [Acidobacteriaceae bacterium]
MSVPHRVVSQQEWIEARKALLSREKEMTRLRDAINRERLALPWVRVDREYIFDTPEGPKSLMELFDGRSQLILYHFMLGPGWDAGCPGCSFLSDHVDGALVHLNHHDVTYVAVSRAPMGQIDTYKKRMGWRFPWVSSNQSSFNFDYGVSFTPEQLSQGDAIYNYEPSPARITKDDMELPGMSAFFKDEDGQVYHAYSSYARGAEEWIGTLMILDRAPLGRNEGSTMDFVRRHDEYEGAPKHACCH